MSKKKNKAADLSEIVVVERAKSMANEWMWAISLQLDRIKSPREKDKKFHPFRNRHFTDGFNEADFHFLVISLGRLRQAAATIEHSPLYWDSVCRAIEAFDAALPWRKRFRDVFEHLEDYAVDSDGRRTATSRCELQAWSAGEDGVHWLGYDVDWQKTEQAARDLYASVKAAYDSSCSRQK